MLLNTKCYILIEKLEYSLEPTRSLMSKETYAATSGNLLTYKYPLDYSSLHSPFKTTATPLYSINPRRATLIFEIPLFLIDSIKAFCSPFIIYI